MFLTMSDVLKIYVNYSLTTINFIMHDFLCRYKDIGGLPGEGIHKYRFMGVAIVDVLGTIFGTFVIYLLSQRYGNKTMRSIPYWAMLIAMFLLAIIMHRLFCVQTAVNVWLFSS